MSNRRRPKRAHHLPPKKNDSGAEKLAARDAHQSRGFRLAKLAREINDCEDGMKARAEQLLNQGIKALNSLFALDGDEHAGRCLTQLLCVYAHTLHFVYLHRPGLAKSIKESMLGWPRVFSSRLKYGNMSVPTRIAVRLVLDLMDLERDREAFIRSYEGRLSGADALSVWNQLKRLESFNKRNARAYARAAKPLFVAQFGKDFERHNKFAEYARKTRGAATIKGRRETLYPRPGDLRKAIWKDVVQGFQTIAPQTENGGGTTARVFTPTRLGASPTISRHAAQDCTQETNSAGTRRR